jgi:hypothetical protein
MDTNEIEKLPAWLQIYLAKHARAQTPAINAKPVGRPARAIPARRTSLWLTAGDRKIIEEWQEYVGRLTGKTISIGDTVALLTRVCDERLAVLGGKEQFSNIADLTLALIGGDNF